MGCTKCGHNKCCCEKKVVSIIGPSGKLGKKGETGAAGADSVVPGPPGDPGPTWDLTVGPNAEVNLVRRLQIPEIVFSNTGVSGDGFEATGRINLRKFLANTFRGSVNSANDVPASGVSSIEDSQTIDDYNSSSYVDDWSSVTQGSGLLTIGVQYKITGYQAGDDFSNVGASSNANGIVFIATGTTPLDWSNGTVISLQTVNIANGSGLLVIPETGWYVLSARAKLIDGSWPDQTVTGGVVDPLFFEIAIVDPVAANRRWLTLTRQQPNSLVDYIEISCVTQPVFLPAGSQWVIKVFNKTGYSHSAYQSDGMIFAGFKIG